MVIGLSGLAGAGKDFFFSLLSKRVKCKRYALADDLKKDVRNFCKSKYGIDPLDCSREEKSQIRQLLVFHGSLKRQTTEGRHWVELLSRKLKKHNYKTSIPIITDIRYDEFPKDEIHWLKEKLGGILVHISLYDELIDHKTKKKYKSFLKPPNPEEQKNDPEMKKHADYTIEWRREIGTTKEIEKKLIYKHVEPLIYEMEIEAKYIKKLK
jgi:hypothetical protein